MKTLACVQANRTKSLHSIRSLNGDRTIKAPPTWAALVLAVASLLGLLASPLGSVTKSPQEEPAGSRQPRAVPQPSAKIDAKQPNVTLFKNVKVFDGKSDKLSA